RGGDGPPPVLAPPFHALGTSGADEDAVGEAIRHGHLHRGEKPVVAFALALEHLAAGDALGGVRARFLAESAWIDEDAAPEVEAVHGGLASPRAAAGVFPSSSARSALRARLRRSEERRVGKECRSR